MMSVGERLPRSNVEFETTVAEGLVMAVRLPLAEGAHCGGPYARLFACGTHYALTSGIPSAVCDELRLSH